MDYRQRMSVLVNHMASVRKQMKDMRKNYNDTRDALLAIMKRRKLTQYDNTVYTVKVYKGGTYHSFSTRLLRKYEPNTYKDPKFQMLRKRRGSIRVKRDL